MQGLGEVFIKQPEKAVLAALRFAANKQNFSHHVFLCILLGYTFCIDGLFADAWWDGVYQNRLRPYESNTLPSYLRDAAGPPQTHSALIDLGYARYQGTYLSAGVNQYLGMRYAAPPLGDLRWRAPSDPASTEGIQSASEFGSLCFGLSQTYSARTLSEDCLFINVWAPSDATPSKLPVWFYIQGGGYNANSNANYNGTKVVEESGGSIIFVNFNYRVGAYGFLASEKVRNNGDLNAGLLDQRKALEWAQNGDPGHVVIHGTSAGAGSLALHLIAYGGRDDKLFIGGIGESAFLPRQPLVSELEFQFERFAQDAGCPGPADGLACLRSNDTLTLQAANKPSAYPEANESSHAYFTPCVDGDLLQDYPILLFERGKFVRCPCVFGDDSDEGSYFAANAATPADVANFMVDQFPHLTPAQTDAIDTLMPPLSQHAPYFPSASAAYGEGTFTCPSIVVPQSYVQYFDPYKVWSYCVNIQQTDLIERGLGVPHALEIPAIFGPGFAGSPGSFATYNAPIVPVIMNYWISFIRDLNPNYYKYYSAPYWEVYTCEQRQILLQTNATAMEQVPTDQLAR